MNKRIRNKKAKQARLVQLNRFTKKQKEYTNKIFDLSGFDWQELKEDDKNWIRLASRMPNESTESFFKRASIKLSQSEPQPPK